MKLQLQRLAESMHAATNSDEAVKLLRDSGDILGMRLPCALEDVSSNAPVRDSQGRRIADLLGWPEWMTDNWYGHAYVRQHPIYLRCRFESEPFGNIYAEIWDSLGALTPAQQQLKKDTERFGIIGQITVPIHFPLGQTGCVLWSTRESVNIDDILESCGHYLTMIGHLFMTVMRSSFQPKVGARDLTHLTDRQIDCLFWLASGKTIQETAIILGISVHTVREHLRAITKRLHAVNTPNAIALATQLGIIGRLR